MEFSFDLKELLNKRIAHHCERKFLDGHYDSAAHSAMIQVEKALREKDIIKSNGFEPSKFVSAQYLSEQLFSDKKDYIKLVIPLPGAKPNDVANFFKGSFGFYRNYTAHDGAEISKQQCIRILIISSELLDLIDSSHLSYYDLGGLEGLLKYGLIESEKDALEILIYLDDNCGPAGDPSGFEEDMLRSVGYDLETVEALLDLNIVLYSESEFIPSFEDSLLGVHQQTIYSFQLTELGKEYMRRLKEK